MSILDNIYRQGQTVGKELKGMNAALSQMQQNDKKEYKLDAQDRKYTKERDRREKQDRVRLHKDLFTNTERQVQSVSKQEQGKKLATGLASATSAAIKKAVQKKAKDKKLDDGNDIDNGGTGGPSFTVKEILSSPLTPVTPMEVDDGHEERLAAIESIVFAQPQKEKFAKHQSGGFAGAVPNLGQPGTGDHFYTHVEPGSYVLNRNAVQAMGFQGGGNVPVALEQGEIVIPPGQYDQKMMDFINYAAAPRFQSGGLVEASHPDTGSGYSVGKDYKGRPSTLSKSAAEALQKMIQESGGQVKTQDITSAKRSPDKNAAVGGVKNSNHLTGNAMDIHGSSKAWIKENGAKYGWHNLVYQGHDGHFDFKGQQGPLAEGETRANEDVKESPSEQTSGQEAADQVTEQDQESGGGLGFLANADAAGPFAGFFSALNDVVFGGGDNQYKIGLGDILGGTLPSFGKIGVDMLTGAQPASAAEPTIPQKTGSKGGADLPRSSSAPDSTKYDASANLKPVERQALNVLGKYESDSSGGYNAVNQGAKGGDYGFFGHSGKFGDMKQHRGKNLTDLTIGDIKKLQSRRHDRSYSTRQWIKDGKLHAVGRYQFIGDTFDAVVKQMGIPNKQKFDKETQDRMALHLLRTSNNGIGQWVGPANNATRKERAVVRKARQMKQAGGLVSLKKAAMSDDMSKFFVQTDNQLMEQATADAPQVIEMGNTQESPEVGVTVHSSGSNLPNYDLPTRDSCPLSVYYRYHPSLNPQGMNP